MKIENLLVGGLIAAVSVPLVAQTAAPVAPPPPPPALHAMHAPMAPMTRAEVQAKVAEHFARMDVNRDGSVTLEEAKAGRKGGDRLKRIDIRRDGAGNPGAAFDRIDADRNGVISRDEFTRAREVRIEQRVERRGSGAPGAMHHGAMMRGPMMLKMADANKDGRITLQEATTATLQHFDMADTNRDGRLTADEMRAAHDKMRSMHAPRAS